MEDKKATNPSKEELKIKRIAPKNAPKKTKKAPSPVKIWEKKKASFVPSQPPLSRENKPKRPKIPKKIKANPNKIRLSAKAHFTSDRLSAKSKRRIGSRIDALPKKYSTLGKKAVEITVGEK